MYRRHLRSFFILGVLDALVLCEPKFTSPRAKYPKHHLNVCSTEIHSCRNYRGTFRSAMVRKPCDKLNLGRTPELPPGIVPGICTA